jgi:hypothetical protein
MSKISQSPAGAVATLAVGVVLLLGSIAFGGRGAAAAVQTKPDLVVQFPDVPRPSQHAPIYVDAYTEPGTVLYRFDSVLFNQGGTLDLFRDATTGHVFQAVWDGGIPSVPPDPNTPPPAGTPGLTIEDLTARGAAFQYVAAPDHNHFHFENAAQYSLLVPGMSALGSAKIGFCFADDYGKPPVSYFPYPYTGPGMSWCAVGQPDAQFFREGISPGGADLYNSQVGFQWIDVTGLAPGTYSLRGEVDPGHILDESDYSNNVTVVKRVVPGVIARSVAVRKMAAAVVPLSGTVVGPAIPARASANCYPRSESSACLVTDGRTPKLRFSVASAPCFGHIRMRQTGATKGVATYTPNAKRPTVDGFSYVARDARGLVSTPAYVRIGTPRSSGPPQACLLGVSIGPDRRAHLSFVTTGKLPPGAHWALFVDAQLAANATMHRQTADTPALQAGRTGFWLELVNGQSTLQPRVQSNELVLNVPQLFQPPG